MFDENSVWNSVTKQSLIDLQNAIVSWGMKERIIEANGNFSDYPLNRYKYVRRSNEESFFEYLQVVDGATGLNSRRRNPANDRFQEFYPNNGTRLDYAIDCSDYRNFEDNPALVNEWLVGRGVIEFASKIGGGGGYRSYFEGVWHRLIRFYIILNEHLQIFWYTMFRNAEQFQANRNLLDSETRGIRLVFHAKMALYLSKSLTEKEIEPKFTLIEKIRMEGGFVRSATNFSMICSYIQEWITRYDLRSNYSPGSILKSALVSSEASVISLSSVLPVPSASLVSLNFISTINAIVQWILK